MKFRFLFLCLGLVPPAVLLAQKQKQPVDFASLIQSSVFAQSRVMMHDVVNPPAACRYYAYGMLGAYAIVTAQNKDIARCRNVYQQLCAGVRSLIGRAPITALLLCIAFWKPAGSCCPRAI